MAVPLRSAALGAAHGFFTRQGGVSVGPFASLNCSLSGADARDAVLENRARAAAAVGAPVLVGVTQVHGVDVAVVDAPWETGAGPRADAMVTRRPGIGLGIITADCAPVLFAGRRCGWRGACRLAWRAWRGSWRRLWPPWAPAPSPPWSGRASDRTSYEVAADLRDEVLARDAADARFFTDGRPGHWLFDLPGYCAASV